MDEDCDLSPTRNLKVPVRFQSIIGVHIEFLEFFDLATSFNKILNRSRGSVLYVKQMTQRVDVSTGPRSLIKLTGLALVM